ncbi:MAG: TIGR03560 family F420-dependent LLM class oxidoreductase [archaeon]
MRPRIDTREVRSSVAKFGIMLPVMVPSSPPPHDPYHALQYSYRDLDLDLVKMITLEAERLGYHSAWVSDHLSREACKDRFEGWTTLCGLAPLTKSIRLGTMVLCNLYRHPGLLAMMAATADVLSGGRLEFGIGAGWSEDECREYGLDFPEAKTRLRMLGESVDIIRRLWTEDKVTYHGNHYDLDNAYCRPRPIQKPHPPILIGGAGEKVTLKIVAKYADKSNFSGTLDVVAKKLNILKKNCSDVGRDYESIQKTCGINVVIHPTREEYLDDMKRRYSSEGRPGQFEEWLKRMEADYVAGTPDECLSKIRQYVNLGVALFVIRFGDIPSRKGMELFAKEVIPKLGG